MMKERDWTDRALAEGETMSAAGLTIHRAPATPSCLISGDLEAAIAALAPGARSIGLFQDRPPIAAIRIARDRALLVGATGEPGWRDGYAISPATGLYTCFRISGADVMDALAEGTGADLTASSPAASLQFAGITCLLTRQDKMAELWVEAAMATYMTTWLAGRAPMKSA